MEDKQWLTNFDESFPKFKWFIEEYFVNTVITKILLYRKNEDVVSMRSILNDVWFILPDNKFNIRENPEGWKEFLNLLEA